MVVAYAVAVTIEPPTNKLATKPGIIPDPNIDVT
jgi:hypothetical protein